MEQNLLFKKEEVASKFKNCTGTFNLNGVQINYIFEADKFGMPHFEFRSEKDKQPNDLTETGYRSYFCDVNLSQFNILEEVIKSYLEAEMKANKKPCNLIFGMSILSPIEKDYMKMTTLEKMEAHNKRLLTKKEESVNKEKNTLQEQQLSDEFDEEEEEIEEKNIERDKNFEIQKEKEMSSVSTPEYSKLSINTTGNAIIGEQLSESSAHEYPKGVLGSSWGSGNELKGTNEELLEHFLEFFRHIAKTPYAEFDSPFTQTLKVINCYVDFSDSARNILIKKGFDFKKLEEETNKIKATQIEATPEILIKAKTFDLMEKAMSKLRDECWAIKGYFEHFLNRRNSSSEYYLKKIKELEIDTSDLNKLKELYEQKANIYHIYYCKVNEQRWGKPCDEEYSYL